MPNHRKQRNRQHSIARHDRARRWRARLRVCLALLLVTLAIPSPATSHTGAARQNQAGLIVRIGPDEVITRCVRFDEERISGLALLERSGLPFAAVNDERYGAFICGIAGVGCPADRCLCAYPPRYWQYWHLERGGWQISPVGASSRVVRDGDVDGWVWLNDASGPVFDERFGNPCQTDADRRVYLPLVVRAPF